MLDNGMSPLSTPEAHRFYSPQKTSVQATQSMKDSLVQLFKPSNLTPINFNIAQYSSWLSFEFNQAEYNAPKVVRLILWEHLKDQVSEDVFVDAIRTETHSTGKLVCFIALPLARKIDPSDRHQCGSLEQIPIDPSTPTGYTPVKALGQYQRLRSPDVITNEKEIEPKDGGHKFRALGEIYRQLILLTREDSNFSYSLVSCLDNTRSWDQVLTSLIKQNPTLWTEPVEAVRSSNPDNWANILLPYLLKDTKLCEQLFTTVLHHIQTKPEAVKQLLVPLFNRKPELWTNLVDVFGVTHDEAEKALGELLQFCKSSDISGKELRVELDGKVEDYFRLTDQLAIYSADVIPVLGICHESNALVREFIPRLAKNILGDQYEIAYIANQTSNQPSNKLLLRITPPKDAGEPIDVLLVQKLCSLLGKDNLTKLFSIKLNDDKSCDIVFDIDELKYVANDLRAFARLTFEQIRSSHIKALTEHLFCGQLDASLAILKEANPAKLSSNDNELFIRNFRTLVDSFLHFNEAVVTDGAFRRYLGIKILANKRLADFEKSADGLHYFDGASREEKSAKRSEKLQEFMGDIDSNVEERLIQLAVNSHKILTDPYKRLEALIDYIDAHEEIKQIIAETCTKFGQSNDDINEVIMTLFDYLSGQVDKHGQSLSQAFSVLQNLSTNIFGYHLLELEKPVVEAKESETKIDEPIKVVPTIKEPVQTISIQTEVHYQSPIVKNKHRRPGTPALLIPLSISTQVRENRIRISTLSTPKQPNQHLSRPFSMPTPQTPTFGNQPQARIGGHERDDSLNPNEVKKKISFDGDLF